VPKRLHSRKPSQTRTRASRSTAIWHRPCRAPLVRVVATVVVNHSLYTLGETPCARSKETTRVSKAGNRDSANDTPRADLRLCSNRLHHPRSLVFWINARPHTTHKHTISNHYKTTALTAHIQNEAWAIVHDFDFSFWLQTFMTFMMRIDASGFYLKAFCSETYRFCFSASWQKPYSPFSRRDASVYQNVHFFLSFLSFHVSVTCRLKGSRWSAAVLCLYPTVVRFSLLSQLLYPNLPFVFLSCMHLSKMLHKSVSHLPEPPWCCMSRKDLRMHCRYIGHFRSFVQCHASSCRQSMALWMLSYCKCRYIY
jgi:hypothetical protein